QPRPRGTEGDQQHPGEHGQKRRGRRQAEEERVGHGVEVLHARGPASAMARGEQARQEEQSREPQDHRRHVQDLQPEVHGMPRVESGQSALPRAKRPCWPPQGRLPLPRTALRGALAAAGACLPAGNAFAHAGHPHPPTLATAFTPSAWLLLPLAAWALLYVLGLSRLWRRAGAGTGVSVGAVATAAAGVLVLLLSTTWPLDAYGEWLLAAHIAQHMLLLAFVPP